MTLCLLLESMPVTEKSTPMFRGSAFSAPFSSTALTLKFRVLPARTQEFSVV